MMVNKIQTASLTPNLNPHDSHQVYNGLDCCLTMEIFEHLDSIIQSRNEPFQQIVYDFERGMQAPSLVMMERGWRVNQEWREEGQNKLRADREKLQSILNRYAEVVWGRGLNANSPTQMKQFFYGALGLPEQHKYEKGARKVTTNREALEKLRAYFYAVPIINCILALRETTKKLSVLETEISNDGRMRTSYNVAGTETGRWSSSASVDDTGTNLQNITPELRRMFESDRGYKLCYLDLEQAESRVVGLLIWRVTGDSTYLDACESGDLHTTVCRLVWPNLGWTGDAKRDRELADRPFYRHFSYRDMAKRGGHGTNYYGTPKTMAMHLKVETSVMQNFQNAYFKAFPGIRAWHTWVQQQLALHHSITTILGQQRTFYGRGDDSTLREAIAHEPQSVVGQLVNVGLWQVWYDLELRQHLVQILGQVHDAIVFQYPDDPANEVSTLNTALEIMRIPITAECIARNSPSFGKTKTIIIPSECKIGWNWADVDPDKKRYADGNPFGLIKFKGKADERRLDRDLSSTQ